MPLIVAPADYERWLSGRILSSRSDAIVSSSTDADVACFARVKKPENDDPKVIEAFAGKPRVARVSNTGSSALGRTRVTAQQQNLTSDWNALKKAGCDAIYSEMDSGQGSALGHVNQSNDFVRVIRTNCEFSDLSDIYVVSIGRTEGFAVGIEIASPPLEY